MKRFNKNVRYEFKISMHGYGKNVKKALLDAVERLNDSIYDMSQNDLDAIEKFETISIDEKDVE